MSCCTLVATIACQQGGSHSTVGHAASSAATQPTDPTEPTATALRVSRAEGPVRVEALEGTDPVTFVARGHAGDKRLVFLHGMCGHAKGYAQSFQYSATLWGRLIAPQGDIVCGKGPWAKWSADVAPLDERIDQAFSRTHAGNGPIAVIGYSQGATRTEQLARRWPEKYAWLVSIGAPRSPSPRGLGHLKRAVMMAGERDRQDQMKQAVRAFERAGIPCTFIELPQARHGSMGKYPEKTMSRALLWLFDHSGAPE